MKKYCFIFFTCAALFACNGPEAEKEPGETVQEQDSAAATIADDHSVDPHYYDYSKTTLTDDYTDTVFAKFSSATSEDRFTFFVPKGNITETKSVLRITGTDGEIIYEHIFPTTDLIYGYGTSEVKTEKEMVEYILADAKDILQGGIIDPGNAKDPFLSQFSVDNFDRYDIYEESKNSGRMLFHYRLNNESHYVLGYSENDKAVVKVLTCC